jgi:hypothetical protein
MVPHSIGDLHVYREAYSRTGAAAAVEPFRVVTSSGQTYDVLHPELVLLGHNEVTVGTPSVEDPAIYEDMYRISLLHITAMEDLPPRSKPAGNGSRRRRGSS